MLASVKMLSQCLYLAMCAATQKQFDGCSDSYNFFKTQADLYSVVKWLHCTHLLI